MEFELVVSQISKLLLLILVGVFARKKGIINDNGTTALSKIMLNITLPLLTFFSITSYELPEGVLKEGVFIIVMGIIIMMTSLGAGKFLGHKLALPDVKKNVYAAQLMIGNTVFLAFPLMETLFGEIGLIYAIIYYLISLTFIWTVGIYLFNKHEIKEIGHLVRSLVNPCTISFVIGVAALLLRMDLLMERSTAFREGYTFMYDTFYPLGKTTSSLSMLFIGSIIGKMEMARIIQIFRQKEIIILTATKMLVIPLFIIAVLQFMENWMSELTRNVALIESLMPASTITVAIAKENGSDYEFAMEIAIATTIVCVVTIPLMLEVFRWIG